MYVSRIKLKNWRNFKSADVPLADRVFIVGANASGKSNFLDAFRFLRDLAKPGGGLEKAVQDRGGLSKIRCLAARTSPDIEIDVELSDFNADKPKWRYAIGLKQEPRGKRSTFILYERVWQGKNLILNRPDKQDKDDPARLTQTHLEQINSNLKFREIADVFGSVLYFHLVPQLLKNPKDFIFQSDSGDDPFGKYFLSHMLDIPKKNLESRLKKITRALQIAIPQLSKLDLVTRRDGKPHLEIKQEPSRFTISEDQFSDGTLRLIALLWSVMDGDAPLLLEEPELSLHHAIVKRIPSLFNSVLKSRKNKTRQLLISTHSADLLLDKSIAPEETLLLIPDTEGTVITRAADKSEIRLLLEQGMTMGEAVIPFTEPKNIEQLSLFL